MCPNADMRDITVLITTVGGLTSPDIIRAYRENKERNIRIIGVDPFRFATGAFFVDTFYVVPSSTENEELFISAIDNIIKKERVDVVIPCGNEDNLALSKYRERISAKVMVGEYDRLVNAYDKGYVYERLREELPEHCPLFRIVHDYGSFIDALGSLDFPRRKIVIKPRYGRGGRGVYIINDALTFKSIFSTKPAQEYPCEFFKLILSQADKFEELVVMEYLVDPIYSVYSLCQDGKNYLSLTHIREWGSASQTFRGLVYHDEKVESIAANLIRIFSLTYTNNMEFGTADDGRIVLFDLNPRIGASSGIDQDIGLNFPYLALKLLLREEVHIDKTLFRERKRFVRFFDRIWVPQ